MKLKKFSGTVYQNAKTDSYYIRFPDGQWMSLHRFLIANEKRKKTLEDAYNIILKNEKNEFDALRIL